MDRSLFRFVTIHAFDRQTDFRRTDGQAEFSSLNRVCISSSAVSSPAGYKIAKRSAHILTETFFY